ncbi:MAG: molybdopterin biosynthesis protein [Bacillota bacterium]|nr:molybdopterin biosynthesis protein [Bacillota bacterium]
MSFNYLTNIPLEQAREEYISLLHSMGMASECEEIPVQNTCGRITFAPVYAKICSPHYHASAMDGIALKAKLTFGASETTPVVLKSGEFIQVDTGDPIPEECDAVIMIEDVIYDSDGSVRLFSAAAPWQHIRQIGEDICAGEMILPAGVKITPSAIGAMIAGGCLKIKVIKKPVIGIIPTGDELVPPTDEPKPGDILEFNSSIFSAMVEKWGGIAKAYPIVPDKPELLRSTLRQAVAECDAVLLNAGSSAGRDDYSVSIIGEVAEVIYHGIAIKPGKPAILAAAGRKPVLGVPGYPVSGIIVIEEFLKPILEILCGTQTDIPEFAEATLSRPVISGLKYKEFVRVRMGTVNGRLVASPLNRGAGVVSSFMKADGILEVPQGTEGFEAGETVTIKLLRPLKELENSVVVIGSHDPLLDELGNMLHSTDCKLYMSSSHVGSMGGIMALRRGEAHAAGCHLLDESDGRYNSSYLRRYFPNGGVRLVECVGRTQGIMVQKGNPLNIRGMDDLFKGDLRYVNRQKGSGTRVLFDYLCKKSSYDVSKLYGYDREELTHTSVAAQIAAGSADAGLGIYSAAQMYGLDFVPVCTEQYDLIIPDYAWETESVQKLIEVLKSDAFKARLTEMGGYTLENPGKVKEKY